MPCVVSGPSSAGNGMAGSVELTSSEGLLATSSMKEMYTIRCGMGATISTATTGFCRASRCWYFQSAGITSSSSEMNSDVTVRRGGTGSGRIDDTSGALR